MDKKLLIIPGYRLYPIETGAGVAQFGIIDELRKRFSITLLYDEHNVEDQHLSALRQRWSEVDFLDWQELRSSWEEYKAKSVLERVKNKFATRSKVRSLPDFQLPHSLKGIWENASFFLQDREDWRRSALRFHLKSASYDLVQTDLPVNLRLVDKRDLGPKTMHVCHELKSKRFRTSAEGLGIAEEEWKAAYRYLRAEELKAISNYDACMVFSDEDSAELKQLNGVHVVVSPFPILDEEFYSGERGTPTRLLFLGPEHHGPNAEGLRWFIEEVYDGELPLDVVGHWSEKTMNALSSDQIQFHGFVEDLTPFFASSAMVVPVRSGAGVRTKILQAMAAKVPVICTAFAAEGIRTEGAMLEFDDRHTYTEAIHRLKDTGWVKDMTVAAQDQVRKAFSQSVLGNLRSSVLRDIMESK